MLFFRISLKSTTHLDKYVLTNKNRRKMSSLILDLDPVYLKRNSFYCPNLTIKNHENVKSS